LTPVELTAKHGLDQMVVLAGKRRAIDGMMVMVAGTTVAAKATRRHARIDPLVGERVFYRRPSFELVIERRQQMGKAKYRLSLARLDPDRPS